MGSTVSRNLRRRPAGVLPHPLATSALAVALAFVVATPAWSNPQGGVAIVGSASMASNGNQLVVTTQNGAGQNYSAINWQSFSIPQGSSTYFQQPNAASTVINRVVSSTPSLIYGTLGSNGKLVLVNQSGITVGAGAVVDTAGFTASALRMSDADALAGRLRFGEGDGQTGTVSVQGQVLARSGDVVLLGANVDTGSSALIQAPNGNVLLAAGQQIDVTGRGLEGIVLRLQAPSDTVVNLGKLQGDAVGLFAGSLHHSGDIQATAVTVEGGKVVLKAAQSAQVDGSITAKALNNTGGSVMVTADQVVLGATALVDVSGANGGGEALIGGGFQGKDTRISNAKQTTVAAGARIVADATVSGNGGSIAVWSDDATAVHGSLSAKGAGSNGNGGNLETSGHHLDTQGIAVNASASASGSGKAGDWLLDPYNITIVANNGNNNPDSLTGSSYTGNSNDSLLDVATVNSALSNGTNVTVATGAGAGVGYGDIIVASAISYTGSAGQSPTLTLNAANSVFINSNVTAAGSALNMVVNAATDISLGSSSGIAISTNGGSVQMTAANGSITGYGGSITTGGGNVTLHAANSVDSNLFGSENLSIYATGQSVSSGNGKAGGNISVTASFVNLGALSVNGGSTFSNGANGGNAGSISIVGAVCDDCSSSIISSMTAVGASGYGSGISGAGGSVSISLGQGITLGGISADTLNFTNERFGMTLSSGTIKAMNLSAAGDINVNTTGMTRFSATTTGSGGSVNLANNSTSNIGALELVGITALNGDVVVSNYGALTTTGAITASGSSGLVSLTAHSPITIGAGGIKASGDVTLTANTVSTNSSNITINGSVQSANTVSFVAYNNITQNSFVSGYGVSASSTNGVITFGANGYTAGSPVSYTDIHGAVTVPLLPASALGNTVFDPSTVLDLLVATGETGTGTGPVFTDNPFAPDNRKKSDLVMEGQQCTP